MTIKHKDSFQSTWNYPINTPPFCYTITSKISPSKNSSKSMKMVNGLALLHFKHIFVMDYAPFIAINFFPVKMEIRDTQEYSKVFRQEEIPINLNVDKLRLEFWCEDIRVLLRDLEKYTVMLFDRDKRYFFCDQLKFLNDKEIQSDDPITRYKEIQYNRCSTDYLDQNIRVPSCIYDKDNKPLEIFLECMRRAIKKPDKDLPLLLIGFQFKILLKQISQESSKTTWVTLHEFFLNGAELNKNLTTHTRLIKINDDVYSFKYKASRAPVKIYQTWLEDLKGPQAVQTETTIDEALSTLPKEKKRQRDPELQELQPSDQAKDLEDFLSSLETKETEPENTSKREEIPLQVQEETIFDLKNIDPLPDILGIDDENLELFLKDFLDPKI